MSFSFPIFVILQQKEIFGVFQNPLEAIKAIQQEINYDRLSIGLEPIEWKITDKEKAEQFLFSIEKQLYLGNQYRTMKLSGFGNCRILSQKNK